MKYAQQKIFAKGMVIPILGCSIVYIINGKTNPQMGWG